MTDFPGSLAAWRLEFSGREDSLEATWELAGIEEQWGDSLLLAGEQGSSAHYWAARLALVPPGAIFTSSHENERRMEAYGRITEKLHAIGPDDRPRNGHMTPAQQPPPDPPVAQPKPAPQPDEDTDHWRHHHLGCLWLDAAKALAMKYPNGAHDACQRSRHHFERYSALWSAHLPASRWDSDGSAEMEEVQDIENALAARQQESPLPEWANLLLAGDWQASLATLSGTEPPPEFKPLAILLAEACQTAG